MRLADFILANIEPILVEWEAFARSIWPGEAATDPAEARDDAENILRAVAADMISPQTAAQSAGKSKGEHNGSPGSARLMGASTTHGAGRVTSGFELWGLIAEYRALRASVLHLWRDSLPVADHNDLDDLTRFNEAMDQSLTEAVRSFVQKVEENRQAALAEIKAARAQADEANRAKDLFLATLSHELRTPLNAIVGWMNILRDPARDEATLNEGLDVIDRNTRAQVQLIEDVLDVSRIVNGKLRLEIGRCNLIDIINAGIESVRAAARAREITLAAELDPAACEAACDAARMQQVVWNLVSNAVKFSPKRSTVRVTLARQASRLEIKVSDNGAGIAPQLLPYVFERFRQADGGTRRQFGGLGLGLSIVKHIIEQHGGAVAADSPGEGQGATFTVSLPIQAVRMDEDRQGEQKLAAAGTEINSAVDAPARLALVRLDGLRVLVVDDEADSRKVLLKVLEAAGAVVRAAAGVDDALSVLAARKPDVLVSDLGMPGRDGFDLIREVRRLGHGAGDLPAVALTAFAQEQDARRALAAGFQVHVPKPVDAHKLTAVIARLAGRTG